MRKTMLLGATAIAIVASSVAYAQMRPDGPEGPRPGRQLTQDRGFRPTPEDMSAFTDARIAGLKAGLKLTPAQEQHWGPFEQAMRERAQMRIERMKRFAEQPRGDAQQQAQPTDPIERLQKRADAMTRRAAALKKFADATVPLYQSLDENQKRRFLMLARPMGPHHRFEGPRGPEQRDMREQRGPRDGREQRDWRDQRGPRDGREQRGELEQRPGRDLRGEFERTDRALRGQLDEGGARPQQHLDQDMEL